MLSARTSELKNILLDGWTQYLIPTFQRSYIWKKQQWEDLWENLIELHHSKISRQHFWGTLVTMHVSLSPENTRNYLLLDGQQRLVTASILLSAIRDVVEETDSYLSRSIHDLLWIPFLEPGRNKEPRLLLKTRDQEAFQRLLEQDHKSYQSNIFYAYNYFLKKLKSNFSAPEDYCDLLKTLATKFVLVIIELSSDEDPYSIIKNLNPGLIRLPNHTQISEFLGMSQNEILYIESQLLNYRRFAQAPELLALISSGENAQTEFKEAARINPYTNNPDNKMRDNIAKSVAAFMNSKIGGNLLIGIADDGEIKGINHEFSVVNERKGNWDSYSLFITNFLNSTLEIETPFQFYTVRHYTVDEKDVCCISVKPASSPVYIRKKLYVRAENQSLELQGPDLIAYVKEKWGSN